jgi:type IV pilus assembly protein PilE
MHQAKGFTLIELMIVVVVVAILASIAVPSYTQYITRGKIQEATSTLANLRVKMEQYYMDNRRYSTDAAGGTCGVPDMSPTVTPTGYSKLSYFTVACVPGTNKAGVGDQSYVITATGEGFTFTINQANVKKTTAVKTGWTLPSADCWVQKKNGQC